MRSHHLLWLLAMACQPADPMAPTAPSAALAARVEAPELVGIPTAAIGDLDGDGDLDRVVLAGYDQFQPWLNDGQGAFLPGVIFERPMRYGEHRGYEVGDVNGDGYGDIVAWASSSVLVEQTADNHVYEDTSTLRVVYGAAGGPPQQTLTDLVFDFATIHGLRVLGDVDDDGDDDLAIEYSLTAAQWAGYNVFAWSAVEYFGIEDVDLGEVATFYHHTRDTIPVAVAGDVNVDGIADDLVGADGLGGVRWRAGTTEGHPRQTMVAADWTVEEGIFGRVMTRAWEPDWSWTPPAAPDDAVYDDDRGRFVQGLGDVNQDGFGDMVVIEQVGVPSLLWFAGGVDGFGPGPAGTLRAEAADQLLPDGVAGGDVDGDGVREAVALVKTREGQRLLLFFHPGPGTVLPFRTLTVAGTATTLRAPGDVNGDGADDLLVGTTLVYGEAVSCPGGAAPQAWYPDSDADGYPSSAHALLLCSQPAGSSPTAGTDCNDVDPLAHPGAAEAPFLYDLNCDGFVVAGVDLDGDDYTSANISLAAYACPAGARSPVGGDCDDADPRHHPGGAEVTGTLIDANCDGAVRCYVDADADGLGTTTVTTYAGTSCATPGAGVTTTSGDCDDTNPAIGRAARTWLDADGDGWGASSGSAVSCPTPGRVAVTGDCDDGDAAVSPGGVEVLGGQDEDCDGLGACIRDADNDGYGAGAVVLVANAACGPNLATVATDCDDRDRTINPGRAELLGGVDEDCDGALWCDVEVPGGVDEDCDGLGLCFVDDDADGWGSAVLVDTPDVRCTGFNAPRNGDCDDLVAVAHPGGTEVAGGGDEDCDGTASCYLDLDADGVAQSPVLQTSPDPTCTTTGWSAGLGDCDDANPQRSPALLEVDGNMIDENCDGLTSCYNDADRDGAGGSFGTPVQAGQACAPPQMPTHSDCNDTDPTIYRGAPEIPGNGADEDCDQQDLFELHVHGFVQNNQRYLRATVAGLPPGTPVRIYASRTGAHGNQPCPIAGQQCGDLIRPFIWAAGVIGPNGRYMVTDLAPNLQALLQGFTLVNGQVGKTMIGGHDWFLP